MVMLSLTVSMTVYRVRGNLFTVCARPSVSRQTELYSDSWRRDVWNSLSTWHHAISTCRLRLWSVIVMNVSSSTYNTHVIRDVRYRAKFWTWGIIALRHTFYVILCYAYLAVSYCYWNNWLDLTDIIIFQGQKLFHINAHISRFRPEGTLGVVIVLIQ